MWFREDLRMHDNTALYHASCKAKRGLIAIYIISTDAWKAHDVAACRIDFILRNLKELETSLRSLNIPLLIIRSDFRTIPENLLKICAEHEIDAVYFNQQYEVNEARRDLAVENLLRKSSVKIFSYTDQVILAPGEVLTAKGNYYTVFTPFKKSWIKQFTKQQLIVSPTPKKQSRLNVKSHDIPNRIDNFTCTIASNLWPAGEKQAQQRLANFIDNKINNYAKSRDFPALNGTSSLSPYLTSGVLSPRHCLQAALSINNQQIHEGNLGIITWINELIWREFYKHVLHGFPRVSMHQAFKLETEKLRWNNNSAQLDAWQQGQTGFPLIDAAMRQLKTIGWMHNRLRMVVAMFLVKDLLIDWRLGEKYFMQNLIDGDLSANNGGWQWAASTGTDAVPYFRIFNPISQSVKFDPYGEFIRSYCPELAKLDDKHIHEPSKLNPTLFKQLKYPAPLVDHNQARQRFLQAFKRIKD